MDGLTAESKAVIAINPATMMLAVALFSIEKQRGHIRASIDKIAESLESEREADIKAAQTMLDGSLAEYKHHWKNERFDDANCTKIIDMQQTSYKRMDTCEGEITKPVSGKSRPPRRGSSYRNVGGQEKIGVFMQEMTHRHSKELARFYHENRNACTNCGHAFSESETAHLGYLRDKSPAVLCDRCSILLDETVVRYYWMKDAFERPNSEDKLWRYMDLAKFISLLCTKSLYFAPANSFDDIFEGAKGIATREEEWNNFYLDFFRHAIQIAPMQSKESISKEKLEETAQRLLREMTQHSQSDRKNTCISCWHCNSVESEAMWKLYSINVKNAVAIETTYQRLYQALGEEPYIDIGKVKYIDYRYQYSSVGTGAFWYKRKSFEHEREVRAVIRASNNDGKGLFQSVDLDKLIKCVYVSPYAPEWFAEVVRDVAKKYDLNKPILYSSMQEKPFY